MSIINPNVEPVISFTFFELPEDIADRRTLEVAALNSPSGEKKVTLGKDGGSDWANKLSSST